jgi:hypothetical protein
MDNGPFIDVLPIKMMIFHSYVSLPECILKHHSQILQHFHRVEYKLVKQSSISDGFGNGNWASQVSKVIIDCKFITTCLTANDD